MFWVSSIFLLLSFSTCNSCWLPLLLYRFFLSLFFFPTLAKLLFLWRRRPRRQWRAATAASAAADVAGAPLLLLFLLFPFFFFFLLLLRSLSPLSLSHHLPQCTATVPSVATFTLQRESLSSCSLAEPAHSITSQTEWLAGRQAESLGLSVFLCYLSPLGACACLLVCACNEPASNTATAAAAEATAVRKIRLALLTATQCHLMHFNLCFNIISL